MAKRDESLDAVKGFAIILVMLGHCLVWNNLSQNDPYIYDFIKMVQMPLFMMVSGYLAGKGYKKRNIKETGRLVGKRAFAYLVPFFVWPVLLHPLVAISEVKGILFQLDKGLWFLMTLFIVMVVTTMAAFIADVSVKNESKWFKLIMFILWVLLFYVAFFVMSRAGVTFLSPSLTVTYLPFYVAGYVWTAYVTQMDLWKVSHKVDWVLWFISLVIVIGAVAILDLQKVDNLKDVFLQMTLGMLGSFLCFFGIYQIKNGKLKSGLAKLGRITLELYIFQYAMHAVFVSIRNLGDTRYHLYTWSGLITVLVTFAVMCLVSLIGIWLIKKIPLFDFVLFGHLNSLKQKHQE